MTLSQSFSTPTIGTPVRSNAGDPFGSLSEIVFDGPTGKPRFAVIEMAGDTSRLVVPWETIGCGQSESRCERHRSRTEGRSGLDAYGGSRLAQLRFRWCAVRHRAWRSWRALSARARVGAGFGYLLVTPRQPRRQPRKPTMSLRPCAAPPWLSGHPPPDTVTTMKVMTALALSKRVAESGVNVETRHAVTTLTGTVPSVDTREVAGQIAADTAGVREVRNFITVDPASPQ